MYKIMQTWFRCSAIFQNVRVAKKCDLIDLTVSHDCWCQTGWFEYLSVKPCTNPMTKMILGRGYLHACPSGVAERKLVMVKYMARYVERQAEPMECTTLQR